MKNMSDAVLEGLIHNLRTPLNLVLGYAQKMVKEPREDFAQKTYQAGIKLEDLLQNTWDALQYRHSNTKPINLNEWVNSELTLLHSHLQIKHRFVFNAETQQKDTMVKISASSLGEWFEQLLDLLLHEMPESGISLSIKVLDDATLSLTASAQGLPHKLSDSLHKHLCDTEILTCNINLEPGKLNLDVSFR